MHKIILLAFSFFVLFSCKTTQQAIDHNESTDAPDAFEEGMVEEIDPNEEQNNSAVYNETETDKQEKKQPLAFKDKMENGIDFTAIGTDPVWSIDIKFDSSISFTALGDVDLLQFSSLKTSKNSDLDVVFTSSSQQGNIEVLVKDSICMNAVSGEEFNYSVEVSLTNNKDKKSYKGCGQYLGELNITGEWDFITLNKDSIQKNSATPETLFLTFSLKENSIAGYAGCNTIHGAFDFGYKTINFSPFISTRKFCPNMDTEDKIMKALSDKTFKYTITDNHLTLENEETTLYFQKH